MHEESEFIDVARAAGGLGYVFKTRLALDLADAVRESLAGRPFASPLI